MIGGASREKTPPSHLNAQFAFPGEARHPLAQRIEARIVGCETAHNVTTTYDNLGRITGASQTGHAMTFAWDALNRLTSQTGPLGTFSFQYDLANRRTRITWPDAYYAQYDWSLYDQVTAVRENGASSGAGVLAQYAYDNLGRRTGITRGNGVPTTYGYDAISRVTSIAHDLAGATNDVTFTLAYNPASQITSRTISNTLYAYQPANQSTAYTINGRNEITNAGGTSFTYDSNRNLTNDGVRAYTYDAANRLLSAGTVNYSYGPTGELYDAREWRLAYVGGTPMGTWRASGAVHRRFIPGAGFDEWVGYNIGAGTGDRRWLLQDHQNSVIGYTDVGGASTTINTFDEYGRPGANSGLLQYTGQFVSNTQLGVYNHRNRFYNAQIGRFMQTDPIGYWDSFNLYGYVGNDPMNRIDPWGLSKIPGDTCRVGEPGCGTDTTEFPELTIVAERCTSGWTCVDPLTWFWWQVTRAEMSTPSISSYFDGYGYDRMLEAGEDGKSSTTQCTIATWGRILTESGSKGSLVNLSLHATNTAGFHVESARNNPRGMMSAVRNEGRLRALDRTAGTAMLFGGALSAIAGDYDAAAYAFTGIAGPTAPGSQIVGPGAAAAAQHTMRPDPNPAGCRS